MENVTDIELATLDSSKVIDAIHSNALIIIEELRSKFLPVILTNCSHSM